MIQGGTTIVMTLPYSSDTPSVTTTSTYQPSAHNFSRPRPTSSASSSGTVLNGPHSVPFAGLKDPDGTVTLNGWARKPSIPSPKSDSHSRESIRQMGTPRASTEATMRPDSSNGFVPGDTINTMNVPIQPKKKSTEIVAPNSLSTSLPTLPSAQPTSSSPAPSASPPPHHPSNNLSPPTPGNSLRHRHTLQVPKPSSNRVSSPGSGADAMTTGRFSPTASTPRRASLSLGRRPTRSIHSEIHTVDDLPPDEDAAKWSEAIKAKRAEKRRREEEADDRVLVGTKVDQTHANWVMAYNMLTGIRFVVSRINAKMDRALTDEDFTARNKFSFDITGNELTPSAKYDFKFKDYSPWVFRQLRAKFGLDPADYLMSLTSKYILSELGSPGKSGSFFYFSRDYKYIIKTIHHGEHKFLRKILKEYYQHVEQNPNTLISQFYGLHRVKTPFGRKIHFVVMNNLFPPHRDIHTTYDLKGSTIGRDYNEDNIANNPRAVLKDLNWLRRDMHINLGPIKKQLFVEQVQRDVALLKKLGVMDYSLLLGIHDLERGNKDDIRNSALKVFQPGGPANEELHPGHILQRTPSKMEKARQVKELRRVIEKEVPVALHQNSENRLPEEAPEQKQIVFYSDDSGFRATHEDNQPDDSVYYLGIIDCLTHYGFKKRLEHFWRGLSHPKDQVSAIPPEDYGRRFFEFITGVVKSKEEVAHDREAQPNPVAVDGSASGSNDARAVTEAERAMEEMHSSRVMGTVGSTSNDRTNGTILPVVEEVGEGSSPGRSRRQSIGNGEGCDQGPSNRIELCANRSFRDDRNSKPDSAVSVDSQHAMDAHHGSTNHFSRITA